MNDTTPEQDPTLVRDAERWRFTQRPGYFHMVDREDGSFSVAIQPRGVSVSDSILARWFPTLGEAIDAAIAGLANNSIPPGGIVWRPGTGKA